MAARLDGTRERFGFAERVRSTEYFGTKHRELDIFQCELLGLPQYALVTFCSAEIGLRSVATAA